MSTFETFVCNRSWRTHLFLKDAESWRALWCCCIITPPSSSVCLRAKLFQSKGSGFEPCHWQTFFFSLWLNNCKSDVSAAIGDIYNQNCCHHDTAGNYSWHVKCVLLSWSERRNGFSTALLTPDELLSDQKAQSFWVGFNKVIRMFAVEKLYTNKNSEQPGIFIQFDPLYWVLIQIFKLNKMCM